MSQSTFHGLYVSGLFEVEEKTSPENGWRSEWQTYTVSIVCTGANRDHRLLYEIQAKGFSAAQFWLWQDNIYFLRGSFFPSNSSTTSQDQLIFEGSEAILLAQADDFLGETINSVGITGVGVVLEKKTIVEACCQYLKKVGATEDPLSTVVTVQHSKYHPTLKATKTSKVEYLIRPSPNLSGIASIIKPGRECQIHGFIKDFNEATSSYVVVVNKVFLTDTFSDPDDKTKPKIGLPESASKKPMKVGAEFKSPLPTSASASNAALDTPDTSFSTVSSSIASTSKNPIPCNFDDLSSLPAPPAKKKARCQPKRKASNPAPVEGSEEY
ncbi:uncharacterized protein MELLADRAFT_86418 [Melampsora larici-populina 98AG31]|uniref:Uncharacterized protein n=1 Tax=Melampsora larici-populina (strain 98AG31 / pathotype 3-4-7) TaxID=747676 RepID=F4RLR2_MELLP|nr:uncharacterized protein MELLADRAFT_86418 [Melampsora larici-populina 98AG31]EGG06583.1 hypothetical protein MELLADRAFT_86418 [Melampsora larici-populina 98AG31]